MSPQHSRHAANLLQSQQVIGFRDVPNIDRISARGCRRSDSSCNPPSAPIVTPPESGCQKIAGMKAPIADAEDASSRKIAGDIRAFIKI
jgi:hypothetical protein